MKNKENGVTLKTCNEMAEVNLSDLLDECGIIMEDIGEVSDGYHTFNGLYYQRCILFATLCNTFKELAWKSHRHSTGEECFGGGWFIVGIDTPKGSYTYHYENKYWDMFHCCELDIGKEWDGHTEEDVERLLLLETIEKRNIPKNEEPTLSDVASYPDDKKPENERLSWARQEVRIACADDYNPKGTDYGYVCFASALQVLETLCNTEHSGFGIHFTMQILNDLINEKPLTPIEDVHEAWNLSAYRNSKRDYDIYQSSRMSSLFKNVYSTGKIAFNDINRVCCQNISNPGVSYHSGLVDDVVDNLYPITMPYIPGRPFKVYCDDCLVDPKNGDYDTVAIFHMFKPDGEREEINKFFKESKDGWTSISRDEYDARYLIRVRGDSE